MFSTSLGLGLRGRTSIDARVKSAMSGVAACGLYNPNVLASNFQERLTPTTQAGNGDPVGYIESQANPANDITAFSDANRPTLTADGSLFYWDISSGAPSGLSWDVSGTLSSYDIGFVIQTTDTSAILISNDALSENLNMSSGSSSSAFGGSIGTPAVIKDGVTQSITTRIDLYNAISGAEKRAIQITGCNFTGSSQVGLGRQGETVASLFGKVYAMYGCPTGTISDADGLAWLNSAGGL